MKKVRLYGSERAALQALREEKRLSRVASTLWTGVSKAKAKEDKKGRKRIQSLVERGLL